MAISILCPYCGSKTATRTSERPTPTTVEAEIFCGSCNGFRAKFIGEMTQIRRAEWKLDELAKRGIFEQHRLKEQT